MNLLLWLIVNWAASLTRNNYILAYYQQIEDGTVTVGKWIRLLYERIIQDLEGSPNKNLEKYATTDSPEYKRMVDEMTKRLGITSLKFNKKESLIKAIGLPQYRICTHCFDGSGFKCMKK